MNTDTNRPNKQKEQAETYPCPKCNSTMENHQWFGEHLDGREDEYSLMICPYCNYILDNE